MIPVKNKPNSIAPDATYEFGRTKDNTGSNDGTPANSATFNDLFQFAEKLIASAAPVVVPNNQLDNTVNGYQLFDSLREVIRQGLKARVYNADLNNILRSGLYITTTGSNRPNANFGWVFNQMTDNEDPDFGNQMFLDSASNIYVRVKNSGVWSVWSQFVTKAYVDGQINLNSEGMYTSEVIVNGSDSSGFVVATIPTVNNSRILLEVDVASFKTIGPSSNGGVIKQMASCINNGGTVTVLGNQVLYSQSSGANDPILTFTASGINIIVRAFAGSGTNYKVKTRVKATFTSAV